MGSRGPKAKSNELKEMEGNPGNRKLQAESHVEFDVEAPTCPKELTDDAKAEWKRVVPILIEARALTLADRVALAQYCQAWARWLEFENMLAEFGLTYTDGNGVIRPHPAISLAQKYQKMCNEIGKQFGLNPASRSRMDLPPPPDKTPKDQRAGVEKFCD